MKHPLCKVSDVPDEGSLLVPFFGRKLHVYRTEGRIVAAANTCLHFGGPLKYEKRKLVCEWHGATFDMDTGRRVDGPAPKDSRLMIISTRVEDETLYYVWRGAA